jgi:hypothetical protein
VIKADVQKYCPASTRLHLEDVPSLPSIRNTHLNKGLENVVC